MLCWADTGLKSVCYIAVSLRWCLRQEPSADNGLLWSQNRFHAFSKGFPWVFPASVGCCKCFRASSMRLSTVPLKACQRWRYSGDGRLLIISHHFYPLISNWIWFLIVHLANNNVQKLFQIGIIAGVFDQTVYHIHFGNHAAGRSQGDQNSLPVPTGPRCVPRCNGCALPAQQTSALVKGKRRGDQNGTYWPIGIDSRTYWDVLDLVTSMTSLTRNFWQLRD